MALSSTGLDIRLLDENGRALSRDDHEIVGGILENLIWEQTLSVADSFSEGSYYLVVVSNPSGSEVPYQFIAQSIRDGLVTGRVESKGSLESGEITRFPILFETGENGEITIQLGNANRRVEGIIER